MNYTIEQRPQSQPGACCLTGIHEDPGGFIRIVTSDAFLGSLVISKTAFDQLARELGYVPDNSQVSLLREIKELQDALGPVIADIDSKLNVVRDPVLGLSEALRGIKELVGSVDRLSELSHDDSGETAGSAEGSPEPTAKPQLDGIFSVGSKRSSADNLSGSTGKSKS